MSWAKLPIVCKGSHFSCNVEVYGGKFNASEVKPSRTGILLGWVSWEADEEEVGLAKERRYSAEELNALGLTLHLSSNAWVKPRIRGNVLGAEKGLFFLALYHLLWSFPNGDFSNSSTSLFHSQTLIHLIDCLIFFWILCRFDDGGGTHWWVGSCIIVSNLLVSPFFQKTNEEVFWRWIRVVRRVDTRYT